MHQHKDHAVFGMHVVFALLAVGFLALHMVKAEAALTNRQMMAVKVTACMER